MSFWLKVYLMPGLHVRGHRGLFSVHISDCRQEDPGKLLIQSLGGTLSVLLYRLYASFPFAARLEVKGVWHESDRRQQQCHHGRDPGDSGQTCVRHTLRSTLFAVVWGMCLSLDLVAVRLRTSSDEWIHSQTGACRSRASAQKRVLSSANMAPYAQWRDIQQLLAAVLLTNTNTISIAFHCVLLSLPGIRPYKYATIDVAIPSLQAHRRCPPSPACPSWREP